MANGDVLSVTINPDGWNASIEVEGLGTGGVYDFGLGANNIIDNAKIALNVTYPSYSNGVVDTVNKTIYGVPCNNPPVGAMRLPDPNDSQPDETISGSNVIIKIALSEFIYAGDTVTVSVSAGWFTHGGSPNNSVSDLAVTNNSTLNPAKVIGNWATADYQTIIGTSGHFEFIAFHRFEIDCVKITYSDAHGHSVTSTISQLTKSTDSPVNTILVYQDDPDFTSFIDGDICTARAVVYPKIGDATAIMDTGDGVNTAPTPLYHNLSFRLDKTDKHGKTCVSSTGNDTTGAVYSTQAAAEAGNHFATIAAALTALQTYNNVNAGHNDAGGGKIFLGEGTWGHNSSNGGTCTEWVTVTRMSTAQKSNTILQPSAANSNIPSKFRVEGLTVTGSNIFYAASTKCIYFKECDFNMTNTMSNVYGHVYGVAHNCTGYLSKGFYPFSTVPSSWALLRGNNMSDRTRSIAFVLLGNKNISVENKTDIAAWVLNDNLVYAFNEVGDGTNTTTQVKLSNLFDITHGVAIVQNLIKRYSTRGEPLVWIAGDESTTTAHNVIIWHNTIVGARANLAYDNPPGGGTHYRLNWSIRNNIFNEYNNKDDTFQPNSESIGAWPVGYWVGGVGNFVRSSAANEWRGEFLCGLYSKYGDANIPLEPLYIQDNSADGANTSGGDYHLQSSSPAIGLETEVLLPCDLEGNTRYVNGAPGAYEYIVPGPSITNHPQNDSAIEGQTAQFTVSATGTGTLSYQWYKNSTPVAGETSDAFSFTVSSADNNAQIYCAVTDSNGTTNSNVATLTVETALAVTTHPQNASIVDGQNASFTIAAVGSGTLSYQWYKNGQTVGIDSDTYTFQVSGTDDGAEIYCVVTDNNGFLQSNTATLNVEAALTITAHPQAATVVEGETAEFTVTASGEGALSYQWYKGGVAIDGATENTVSITTVLADNGLEVYCSVTDSNGSLNSNTVSLNVEARVHTSTIVSNITVAFNSSKKAKAYPKDQTGQAIAAVVVWSTDAPADILSIDSVSGEIIPTGNGTGTYHIYATSGDPGTEIVGTGEVSVVEIEATGNNHFRYGFVFGF